MEDSLNEVKAWIRENGPISSLKAMCQSLNVFIKRLSDLIWQLWDTCKPKQGKKEISSPRRIKERQSIFRSITTMISNIDRSIDNGIDSCTVIAIAIEKGVTEAVEGTIVKNFRIGLEVVVFYN